MTPDNDAQYWSLESLNKAYQKGYMAGLAGQPEESQPFAASVPAAAWEAGWVDGNGQQRVAKERTSATG